MIKIKVSELLGKHKMSRKNLSDLTGIRPNTVSALYDETTKRLDIEHLDKICQALDCQPGDILEYVRDAK